MRKLVLLLFIFLLCSCKENTPQYNGYLDADLVYLSSNYPGRLLDLLVHRGELIQKNQLLFKLEQTSENFSVDISQLTQKNLVAQREAIISQLHYAKLNYHRSLIMKKQDAASQNDLELATRDLDVLNKQLQAINLQIDSSKIDTKDKKWQVERKEGYASDVGIIFDTYYTKDEFVQAGQPVLSLLTKRNIKVVFFVPEKELGTIHLNSNITLSSDGKPKLATGRISYISKIAQYTLPIIYSREDRMNLVYRVEAHIDNPDLNHLHLGQPVTLELVS